MDEYIAFDSRKRYTLRNGNRLRMGRHVGIASSTVARRFETTFRSVRLGAEVRHDGRSRREVGRKGSPGDLEPGATNRRFGKVKVCAQTERRKTPAL